eukprot:m.19210 g.19210  ORF g.19210 m.19210 type:complete len:72 (-) comp10895_c0_seq11:1436-1651(-)
MTRSLFLISSKPSKAADIKASPSSLLSRAVDVVLGGVVYCPVSINVLSELKHTYSHEAEGSCSLHAKLLLG